MSTENPKNNLEHVAANINKGNALSQLGAKKEAIECYDQAIKIDPNDANAYFNIGFALSELGENTKRLNIRSSYQNDPNHAGAYNNKGTALSDLDKNEEAIECGEQFLCYYKRQHD